MYIKSYDFKDKLNKITSSIAWKIAVRIAIRYYFTIINTFKVVKIYQ